MKASRFNISKSYLFNTLAILYFSLPLHASSIEENDDINQVIKRLQNLKAESPLVFTPFELKTTDELNEGEAGRYAESLGGKNITFPHKYHFENPELEAYFSNYTIPSISTSAAILSNLLYENYLKTKDQNILKQAAANYHAPALFEAAQYLVNTSENNEIVSKFIHLAGTQGYSPALYELSQAYEYSPQNYGLQNRNSRYAKLLCEEAARLGNEEAQCTLANAFLEGTFNTEISPIQGFQRLDELALQGNQKALNTIKSILRTPNEVFFEARGYVKPDFQWKSTINDVSS